MVKPYSGIAALWLPREGRWRDLVLGLLIVAAWIVVTLPLVGVDLWAQWWTGIALYRQSQALLPTSLYGIGLGRWLPELVTIAIGIVVVVLALGRRRLAGLWRLGIATIVASPSLFSHGFIVAIPSIAGLRRTVFWVVLAITSVAPGAQWFVAIGVLIAAWYVPALGRDRPVGAPVDGPSVAA